MKNDNPEVRNIDPVIIHVYKDDTSSTWDGEFREILDIVLPYNGKRKRIARMRLSPPQIAFLRSRLDVAEANIRKRMDEAFKNA